MTASATGEEDCAHIVTGERFAFGENWKRFLRDLSESQILLAEQSLQQMLDVPSLEGRSFLDIGCGSGLFSLAARRLGARVHSFDYDPESVSCTRELRQRYFAEDPRWLVERASVLDGAHMTSLGRFDVVYSWGVLHHTGAMWRAIANIVQCVAEDGKAFIAIYNDQGRASHTWKHVKKIYITSPRFIRPAIAALCAVRLRGPTVLRNMVRLRPPRAWLGDTERGMKIWTDIVDWVGGYPFEVAKPEEIFYFFRSHGLELLKLKTCAGGRGCCEYVFQRARASESPSSIT